jgi:SOS-response transcriptional repressor LexA
MQNNFLTVMRGPDMFCRMTSYRGDDTTGFQSPAQDYVEPVLDLVKALGLDGPGLYPMRIGGNGFRPRGIHDGDFIIANAAADPTSNKVCVAFHSGEVMLATLHQTDDGWAIREASGKIVPVTDDVEIWALVKALVRTNV